MKKVFCLVLAGIIISLNGCKPEESQFGGQAPLPTDTAASLGINSENYPVIDGSTSTLNIVCGIYKAMFGENSENSPSYPAEASKTVPSYNLLMDKDADMIIVPYASRDILNSAKEKGVELEFYRIAAEALIFITSSENSAQSITSEQIRGIYINNSIKNWNEIGGPDKKLVPICRNADSGSQSQMDNLVLNNEKMHPDIKKNHVELTMEGMLEQVAFYQNGGISGKPTESFALGYTLYTYLRNMNEVTGIGERLKILAFDGIQPEPESLADGSYSLTDGYYAVVRSDLPEGHTARTIIKWLQGGGSYIIEGLGLIPYTE